MSKGKLFVIEGSDGSGKQTQASMLYETLKNQGKKVRLITFPNYQSPSSELVKMYLSGKFGESAEKTNIYAVSTFYAVDRFSSYELDWKEFYEAGGIVIADRYTTSNLIHQGSRAVTSGLTLREYMDWLYDLEYAKYGIPKPDQVIFLDVHPTVSFELMKDRVNKITNDNIKDIHEKDLEFLLNSYQTAKEVASHDHWAEISCTDEKQMRSREDIASDVFYEIMTFIN